MAAIEFTTAKYSPNHYVDVDQPFTYVPKGGSIEFTNKLDGGATVRVRFFEGPLKKNPVNQLCAIEQPDGSYVVVDVVDITAAEPVTCTLTKGDVGEYFAYSAETLPGDALFHKTLDPVIIIQPMMQMDESPPSKPTDPGPFLAGVIIGAVIAWFVGLMVR